MARTKAIHTELSATETGALRSSGSQTAASDSKSIRASSPTGRPTTSSQTNGSPTNGSQTNGATRSGANRASANERASADSDGEASTVIKPIGESSSHHGAPPSDAPPKPEARERILAAATHLFATNGLDGTSLQAVAEAALLRKQSLLWHFRSKEDLHRAVLEALLSRWSDALPQLLRAAARQDRFDALLDETLNFFSEDPDRARLLMREALDRPDGMRSLLSSYVSPWMSVLTDYISRAQAANVVRSDVDPAAYVSMVILLVIGGVATADTLPSIAVTTRSSRVPVRIRNEIKRVARAALME